MVENTQIKLTPINYIDVDRRSKGKRAPAAIFIHTSIKTAGLSFAQGNRIWIALMFFAFNADPGTPPIRMDIQQGQTILGKDRYT